MALRNTKITRDIALNYNKLLSSKADIITISSKKAATEILENVKNKEHGHFRYIVSDSKKQSLPKIEFHKEPEELVPPEMRHLQPAMLPKYIESESYAKNHIEWEPQVPDKELQCPFPEPIRELRTKTLTISDQKKAELKSPNISVNFKSNNFSIINRNYSTSPFQIVSRALATKKSSPHKKEEKCDEAIPKKCVKRTHCPRFIMKDCPTGKASDCRHHYLDRKCEKKFAPYPSYSESCAERLEDDPSECMQCPWQKCGGTEGIKPPKRSYHTSTGYRHQTPAIPGLLLNNAFFVTNDVTVKDCDAKKNPCPRPPGKCERREKKEEKPKCPPQPEEKKKKCTNDWTTAYGLWSAKDNIIPAETWHSTEQQPLISISSSDGCETKFPYDENQSNYDVLRKRKNVVKKNPKCQRKKRKILPDDCPAASKKDCASNLSHPTVLQLDKKCPTNGNRSDCPKRTPKCPVVDKSIDGGYKPKDPCCEKAKKNMIKRRTPRIKPRVYVPERKE